MLYNTSYTVITTYTCACACMYTCFHVYTFCLLNIYSHILPGSGPSHKVRDEPEYSKRYALYTMSCMYIGSC